MKRFTYNRWFPTPRSLRMSAVGLDISDTSLRIAELVPRHHELELARFGRESLADGVIESGKIINAEELKKSLRILKKKYDLSYVRASLPEEQVYLFHIFVPRSESSSIRSFIEIQLEEHIPISAAEAVFDYEVFYETPDGYDVEVCSIPQAIIFEYTSLLKDAGLTPVGFELEAQSIARAVVPRDERITAMVIDFGDTRTGLSVVSNGTVLFTSTIDFGGRMLTHLVEKNFNIPFAEAEKMKRTMGLQRNSENHELFPVLLNGLSVVRDEINKMYLYWQGHPDGVRGKKTTIEKIILAGGDSNLVGLAEYLSVSLKIPVELGRVWSNINTLEDYVPPLSFEDSLSYATALGLALGDFEYD